MSVALALGIACAAGYLALLTIKAGLSLRYVRRHPDTAAVDGSITVVQPILAGDPYLRTALELNLQHAPQAQFLWLVDQDDSLGWEVTQALQRDCPQQVRLLACPPCPAGKNPKAYKLGLAMGEIQSDFVAVLDDDTVLAPGHPPQAIARLAHCDLYTGLPIYDPGDTLFSSLVAHFVNNNSIVTYLSLLNWMPPMTINGMFYVLRRDTLLRWGGWGPIAEELCDDYAVAKLARRHSGRIHQGVTAVRLRTTVNGCGHYFRLMHRWFVFAHVLVLDQPWRMQLQLALFLGLPPLLLWGSLPLVTGGWLGAAAFAGFLVARHVLLRWLQRTVVPDPPCFTWWQSVLSELLQVVHDIHAWISPVITWRMRRIRVHRDGTFETLHESST